MEQARCVYDETLSSVRQSTVGTQFSPACLANLSWTRCKPCVKGLLQLCKRALNIGHPTHLGRESLNNGIVPLARINCYEMAHLSMRARREAAAALACAGRSPGRAGVRPGQALREARRPCTGRCQS